MVLDRIKTLNDEIANGIAELKRMIG